jgi:tRNA dimethylallyltransferase
LVLQGLLKIDQAVEEMKQETRHLAKRQLTWFRQDHEIRWLHPQDQKDELIESVKSFLAL